MKSKGHTHLVEWCKNLLILLLSLSAIYLLGFAYTSGGGLDSLRTLFASTPAATSKHDPAQVSSTVVYPVRLAVYQDGQRYGVQYDQTAVDAVHADLATLLSEALSSAGKPEVISERDWRDALCRTGIFVDYFYALPLDTLSAQLGTGQETSALSHTVRRVCLAEDKAGGVSLFYINEIDGMYYACQTTLSLETHLQAAVDEITPNGALFSFEVSGMETLAPYTLLTAAPQAKIYTADNPLQMDSSRISELLTALTFHSQGSALDPVSGGQYTEGNDFLRLSPSGVLTFHTVGDTELRFQVADTSMQGVLNYVSSLAKNTVGAWCGQARIQLSELETTEDGLIISFQYFLNGSPVSVSEGYAARFVVQNGAVTDFSMFLRTYGDTGETSPLLPVLLAAAAMEDLDTKGKELALLYQDTGAEMVGATWAAQ